MEAAVLTSAGPASATMSEVASTDFVITEDMEVREESMRQEREHKFDEQNKAIHQKEVCVVASGILP